MRRPGAPWSGKHLERPGDIGRRHAHRHADSAVERPMQLPVGHPARPLQPVEDRIARPCGSFEHDMEPLREGSRNIVDEATARDVRESLDGNCANQCEQRLHVDAGWRQQPVVQRSGRQASIICQLTSQSTE